MSIFKKVPILGTVLEVVGAVARAAFRLKQGPALHSLRGPYHVYTQRGTLPEQHLGAHTCVYCGRFDQDETVFTDPPCPRNLGVQG